MLLLTEPAFPELRRQLDDVVMTRRRYHLHDFAEMLENRGFEPLFGSYFTSFGVPIVLATKLFRRLRPTPDAVAPEMQPLHATVNEALFGAAMVEAWLITRGTRMPVGTTLIYVAKRR